MKKRGNLTTKMKKVNIWKKEEIFSQNEKKRESYYKMKKGLSVITNEKKRKYFHKMKKRGNLNTNESASAKTLCFVSGERHSHRMP